MSKGNAHKPNGPSTVPFARPVKRKNLSLLRMTTYFKPGKDHKRLPVNNGILTPISQELDDLRTRLAESGRVVDVSADALFSSPVLAQAPPDDENPNVLLAQIVRALVDQDVFFLTK